MLMIVLYGIVMYYIVIASVLYHAPRHRPAPKKKKQHITKWLSQSQAREREKDRSEMPRSETTGHIESSQSMGREVQP
jgi:hypothetical protein